jgi:hypothetical protein
MSAYAKISESARFRCARVEDLRIARFASGACAASMHPLQYGQTERRFSISFPYDACVPAVAIGVKRFVLKEFIIAVRD